MESERTVSISGMIGRNSTFFADSPVVININGLQFPSESPIKLCRLHVLYDSKVVGKFTGEVGDNNLEDDNQDAVTYMLTFDISSALQAMWSEYDYSEEEEAAQSALTGSGMQTHKREAKAYQLQVFTEYIDTSDGRRRETSSPLFDAGWCLAGGMTEMERLVAQSPDVSALQDTNLRNGDASTKPHGTPERVGRDSITSWVDFDDTDPDEEDVQPAAISTFYPADTNMGEDSTEPHAPMVLRDSQPYVDFLFVNRRGAVETCSALMLEALDINVETRQYSRVGTPAFTPKPSLMATGSDGRRSWSMSSGHVPREWAEWWTMEFLVAKKRKRWWMLYNGKYLPVVVQPAKKTVRIYDRAKQEMTSVEFTVTLALEG